MGVNQLWTILEPIRQHFQLQDLKNKTLAVDLAGWIVENRNCKAIQKSNIKKPHLRISHLMQLGVKVIFVLDGKAPELKADTISQRLMSQKKYSKNRKLGKGEIGNRKLLQADLKECKAMLDYLGIPYVQSNGEAEAMCAFLNRSKVVDGCITDDGDAFLYGAQTVYRNFTLDAKDPHVDCYLMSDIEDRLHLSRQKLISLAILLGCDYFKGVLGIGKETALKFLSRCQDDNVLKRFEDWMTKKDFEETLNLNLKKLPHCKSCSHIGSVRQHLKYGCEICKSLVSCETNSKLPCSCDWHQDEIHREIWKLESTIRQKALATPGFPATEVVNEFIESKNKLPESSPEWGKPDIIAFQKFASVKLGWSEDYCFTKLFPLVIKWQINSIHQGNNKIKMFPVFKPSRILKKKLKKGMPHFKIQWQNSDDPNMSEELLISTEESKLFISLYPELYQDFMKTKSKSRKLKDERSCPVISSGNNQGVVKHNLVKKVKKKSEITDLTTADKENSSVQQNQNGMLVQTHLKSYFKTNSSKPIKAKMIDLPKQTVNKDFNKINNSLLANDDRLCTDDHKVNVKGVLPEIRHNCDENILSITISDDEDVDSLLKQMENCKITSDNYRMSNVLTPIENLHLPNSIKEKQMQRNLFLNDSMFTEHHSTPTQKVLTSVAKESPAKHLNKTSELVTVQNNDIGIDFSLHASKLLDLSFISPASASVVNNSVDLFAEESFCNLSSTQPKLDTNNVNSNIAGNNACIYLDLEDSPLPLLQRIKGKIN